MVDAVVLAVDLESIQMLITPAKCNLKRVVQVGDSAIATNQQAAPDHWADLANQYMQPIDLESGHGSFHDGGQFSGLAPLCHPSAPGLPHAPIRTTRALTEGGQGGASASPPHANS